MSIISDVEMLKKIQVERQKLEEEILSANSEIEVRVTPQRLSTKQAAIYIGMSKHFLDLGRIKTEKELRAIEKGSYLPRPEHIKISTRRVRYAKEVLDSWIDLYM